MILDLEETFIVGEDAIFDFNNKAGHCRNAFPESNREWTQVNNRK
jgi:hypothetical protein